MTVRIFSGDKENDITPANDYNKMANLDNDKSRAKAFGLQRQNVTGW